MPRAIIRTSRSALLSRAAGHGVAEASVTRPHQDGVMTYVVKEMFKTFQGEGAESGRATGFCRFSKCNLLSGHDEDSAIVRGAKTQTCRIP